MSSVPIHVAIPVYNNAEDLRRLLRQLTKQTFASITVLDDASTDHIAEVVQNFPSIKYIRSEFNRGPVAANNLILKAMPESGWLLAIDSDMEIVSDDIPGTLSAFISQHPNLGIGVGHMLGSDEKRHLWNFDYDLNPWRGVCVAITYYPALWFNRVPILGHTFSKLSQLFTEHLSPDVAHKIDWGIEGFFFISVDLYKRLNGFDERFKRFHEGPDLFLRVRKFGYESWYCPDIKVRDLDQGSGSSWHRRYHWWRSIFIYYCKHPSRLLIYKYPRP